ncbi:cytochrome P450 [Nocardia terpenica]|uniref:cytochrome P450 n=1 Tax=Nocardia terpenica TaxID=455432 RepID=UPI002FDFE3A5
MADRVQAIGAGARTRWDEHARWRGAVHEAELPGGHRVWVVAGYDEVAALLADPRLSLDKRHSGGGYAGFALPPALDRNLGNMDGAEHTRVRRLAAPAFSRRSRASLARAVATIARSVFAALPESPTGPVDLMAELCIPVPALTLGSLLGVPADLQPGLRDAVGAMFTFDASVPESAVRLRDAIGWLTTTFTDLVAAKRRAPGEDLISGWVRARDEDGALSEEELVSLAFVMMLAGLENAVYLCGNLIAALLTTADIADWSRRRAELIERANPLPFALRRFATTDLVLGDAAIARGDTVLLSLFGADSDPARGDRPGLMFGRGPHYCLGARITDLVVDAVVPEVFARYPGLRLAIPEAELTYRHSWRSHGLAELPVLLAS